MRKSNNRFIYIYIFISSSFVYNFREFDSQGQSICPFIRSYIDAGIKYIGGCCHVNPEQIRAIRDIIDEYNH